jgi:hypothetical protein
MDKLNLIRAGIFLVAGVVSIVFREGLNNFKNRLFGKLNMRRFVRDERKGYVYVGIALIIISIILFAYSI